MAETRRGEKVPFQHAFPSTTSRYQRNSEAVPDITLIPIDGLPEIKPGDDLAAMLIRGLRTARRAFEPGDVLAIAQKVVSKSEGRIRKLADVVPGAEAVRMAAESGRDAKGLQVVLDETARIVRWQRGVLIVETRHGFVCANAGVDHSNAGAPDTAILLPVDPDASATRIRDRVRTETGVDVPVVITDTFGRAWREGHLNVAIGISGLPALRRYIGEFDPDGYEMRVTEIAIADEIAAATELVMGKLDRRPAALVRGLAFTDSSETARTYVRPHDKDMFR
jgi:coenzyme F420-0:L-glutamate ligase/coenzyme F420-1:gamma-L-glutamate ligase